MTAPSRPIPRPREVTADQFRGLACVWCGTPLGDDAVELGEQRYRALDRIRRWHPRACPKPACPPGD